METIKNELVTLVNQSGLNDEMKAKVISSFDSSESDMDAYEKFVSTIEEILLTSSTEAGIIEMEEVQSYNSEVSDELMKLENEAKELRLVFEKQLAEASSLMMQVDAKTEE